MKRTLALVGTVCVAVATFGWEVHSQGARTTAGDPFPGISAADFELFRLGLEDFLEVEDSEEGLGPAYNGTSCGTCHSIPAVGGVGLTTEVRAGVRDAAGRFWPPTLPDSRPGDTLFQVFSIPGHACQPVPPPEVNVVARRIPLPLFGAGLVEAIRDSTLEALADPMDRDGDGISGRAALIRDIETGEWRIGRFGWKSQHATLRAFAADAYRNEMGITNEIFPTELAFGVSAEQMALCDLIPDPEDFPDPTTGLSGVDNFTAFMRFLAPPPRADGATGHMLGERAFAAARCSSCHVPELVTGPSPHPLFDEQPVPLYSDLLLHDVGTGDGIAQGDAFPEEIRTPALWGLRHRRLLLHDGSAASLIEAIHRHGGEAEKSRRLFRQLDRASRRALLEFLRSL